MRISRFAGWELPDEICRMRFAGWELPDEDFSAENFPDDGIEPADEVLFDPLFPDGTAWQDGLPDGTSDADEDIC
jgi:hypothetical protein